MPGINVNGLAIHYEQQGSGEPLILIPYLGADNACYAFQVADYAKRFTCIALDLRGTGESDKPEGAYSIELFADDVAGFMQALGIARAQIFGLSLGAATALWLAAKYPERVKSLSLHSAWTKTDPFIRVVLEGWKATSKALASVQETAIRSMFPWCFTPELYAARPEYIDSLAAFVRSRPAQPVASFLRHCDAVIAHDAEAQLNRVGAPAQITFGRHDMVTSTRFAESLKSMPGYEELQIFETCSHAPIYESVEEFNGKTLAFLQRHAG